VLTLNHITFACDDPRRVAEFWAAMLGYEPEQLAGSESWAASDPRGEGPGLLFNRMAKSPTIELPIHLDVNVPDRETEVARLLGLGAHLVVTKTHSIGSLDETFTVMRDPEGNGFCVQGPDPRKAHPYVGNVTFSCAEPERLGAFWSEALGWPEEEVDGDFLQMLRDAGLDPAELNAYAAVRHPEGRRPRLLFQRRQKSPTASIPIHFDLRTDDREGEIERLAGLGAIVLETKTRFEGSRTWTVLGDPEGNPFCVE
jgi:predicted enzyme related to lactoylglutathione lyase